MKRSRYNRVVRLEEEDRYLLFNGLTTALISMDQQQFDIAQGVMSASSDNRKLSDGEEIQEIYKILVDGRFIIPDAVDEAALLKVRYNISRLTNPLSLTILPTLACNLRCTYCYERSRHEFMTPETANAICAFVEEQAQRDRYSEFHVTWYGGEPLLAAPTIWNLSDAFLKLSDQYGFSYTATMTTNGTLLTKETADKLIRYNVTGVQVTVDGPKHVHDARRPFRTGTGSSFETILANLEHVVGKIEVSLRINTDKKNAEYVLDLVQIFADKGWLGSDTKFSPYMAAVSTMTEACADVADDCCTIESFFDISLDFCTACATYGVPIRTRGLYHFPTSVKYNCGAVSLNSMLVTPSGGIHKCGLTVSDENESVGNIRDPVDLVNPKLLKWLNFDPFDVAACRACDLLPLCLGACPKRAIDGEDPTNSNSCKYMKRNIDTILRLHGT